MTVPAFKDKWPREPHPIEQYQDESVSEMNHRIDWKILDQTLRRLRENPRTDYRLLADKLTEAVMELMGK